MWQKLDAINFYQWEIVSYTKRTTIYNIHPRFLSKYKEQGAKKPNHWKVWWKKRLNALVTMATAQNYQNWIYIIRFKTPHSGARRNIKL